MTQETLKRAIQLDCDINRGECELKAIEENIANYLRSFADSEARTQKYQFESLMTIINDCVGRHKRGNVEVLYSSLTSTAYAWFTEYSNRLRADIARYQKEIKAL